MTEENPQPVRPLQYASPRDEPHLWTPSRIVGGVIIVPAGIVVGLISGAMITGFLISLYPSFIFGAALITFAIAAMLGLKAYETKMLNRLFFIGATIGVGLVSISVGLTWFERLSFWALR